MCVPVQEHIDILRRPVRWDMDEPKAHAVSVQINDQAAIRNCCRNFRARPSPAGRFAPTFQNTQCAHITEMPDFIRPFGERFDVGRQMIMRVGQHKDTERPTTFPIIAHFSSAIGNPIVKRCDRCAMLQEA